MIPKKDPECKCFRGRLVRFFMTAISWTLSNKNSSLKNKISDIYQNKRSIDFLCKLVEKVDITSILLVVKENL